MNTNTRKSFFLVEGGRVSAAAQDAEFDGINSILVFARNEFEAIVIAEAYGDELALLGGRQALPAGLSKHRGKQPTGIAPVPALIKSPKPVIEPKLIILNQTKPVITTGFLHFVLCY